MAEGKLFWVLAMIWVPVQIVYLIYRMSNLQMSARSLLLGILGCVVLMLFFLDPITHHIFSAFPEMIGYVLELDMKSTWFVAFFRAGLYEESLKLILLMGVLKARRQVLWGDRPPRHTSLWESLIPALWIATGFALVENAWYLLFAEPGGFGEMAFNRITFPTIAHLCFGIFMGALHGLGDTSGRWWRWPVLLMAWLVPVLLHGLYNFILFETEERMAVLPLLLPMAAAAYWTLRRIRRHESARQIAA